MDPDRLTGYPQEASPSTLANAVSARSFRDCQQYVSPSNNDGSCTQRDHRWETMESDFRYEEKPALTSGVMATLGPKKEEPLWNWVTLPQYSCATP